MVVEEEEKEREEKEGVAGEGKRGRERADAPPRERGLFRAKRRI